MFTKRQPCRQCRVAYLSFQLYRYLPLGANLATRVCHTQFENGERLPLICGPDNLPIWWPNLWILTKLRSRGLAFGSCWNYAYFVARAYGWAERRGLPLEERLLTREWLTDLELNSLVDELKIQADETNPKPRRKRPGNIEQFMRPIASTATLVSPETIATRIRVIADYLEWLSTFGINRAPFASKTSHEKGRDGMVSKLLNKVPINHGHNDDFRDPPERAQILRLIEVLQTGHPENPFRRRDTQIRNHLVVLMLYSLGIRIGELVSLKCSAIDIKDQSVSILRTPDDPNDPRGRYQPLVKTRPRRLRLEIANIVNEYIRKVRSKFPMAERHEFLLVSELDGAPISLQALEKMFAVLREKVSGLPEHLTAHMLRHAWNYEFSRICREKGIPADLERQMRIDQMGWSIGSKMPAVYNRTFIREHGDQCSLTIQGHVMQMNEDAEATLRRMRELGKVTRKTENSHAR